MTRGSRKLNIQRLFPNHHTESGSDTPNEAPPAARYSGMSFEMDGNADELRAPMGSSSSVSREALAKLGEEHAAKLVASLGYRIVKRNFRYGKVGEIDIVAYDGECLVFIEVKARQDYSHGTPEASIDAPQAGAAKKCGRACIIM